MESPFEKPGVLAQVAVALLSPILVSLGLQWEDMTTWPALGEVLRQAVCNPVILVAVVVSLWGSSLTPPPRAWGIASKP